jgi:hypothetical protein
MGDTKFSDRSWKNDKRAEAGEAPATLRWPRW